MWLYNILWHYGFYWKIPIFLTKCPTVCCDYWENCIFSQNRQFQGIACSRLVYLNENFYIFIKWTDFKQFLWTNALTRTLQIDRFSRDFLLDIKRDTFGGKYQFFQPNAIPFSVKWTDFKWFLAWFQRRHIPFGEKYQFFQPNAIPFSVKWTDFNEIKEMNRFQWNQGNQRKWLIWTDFKKLPKWTDFSDSNEFSKESLIPFGVLVL